MVSHMDADARQQWIRGGCFALLVAAMALLAYRAASGGAFQLDGMVRIVDNAAVRMEHLTWSALARAAGSYETRPIPMMTLAIDWWRGQGEPPAFFATNLLMHALNGMLVFALLSLLLAQWRPETTPLNRQLASTIGATLWTVHPLASQGVVYIIQRMTSMAAAGVLLAAIGYILFRTRTGKARWSGAIIGLFGGLIGWWSKENAWILPLLLLLIEYGVARRPPRWAVARWWDRVFSLLLVGGALYILVDRGSGSGPLFRHFAGNYSTRPFTMAERVLTQPRVIFFYLGQFLYPAPARLSIEHDFVISTSLFSPPSTLFAVTGMLIWIGAGVTALFRARGRPWAFLALWPLVNLAIESSFVPLELVFEHRMYLPMVGLCGLAALGLLTGLEHAHTTRLRTAVVAVAAALALLLQQATHARVQIWNDPVALWTGALDHAPTSARPRVSLAAAYMKRKEYQRAERLLLEAIGLDEQDVFAHTKLGVVFTFTNRLPLAVHALERAVQLDPARAESHGNLGFAYLWLGQVDRAIEHLEVATAAKPWDAPAHLNLGIAYKRKGWLDRADAQFQRARLLKERVFALPRR